MGDNILQNGDSPLPKTLNQTLEALSPPLASPIFTKFFHQAYSSSNLHQGKPFTKFISVARHLGSSPDTEITKILCFSLGSVCNVKHTTSTRSPDGNISTGEPAGPIGQAILRHIMAVQMGIVVSSSRKAILSAPEPVEIVFCDDQYTDNDRILLEMLQFLDGGCRVRVLSNIESGLQEAHVHTFVLATAPGFALRHRILNASSDVAGMLWTDHVYDDMAESTYVPA